MFPVLRFLSSAPHVNLGTLSLIHAPKGTGQHCQSGKQGQPSLNSERQTSGFRPQTLNFQCQTQMPVSRETLCLLMPICTPQFETTNCEHGCFCFHDVTRIQQSRNPPSNNPYRIRVPGCCNKAFFLYCLNVPWEPETVGLCFYRGHWCPMVS